VIVDFDRLERSEQAFSQWIASVLAVTAESLKTDPNYYFYVSMDFGSCPHHDHGYARRLCACASKA
jgi:hypothetical protein